MRQAACLAEKIARTEKIWYPVAQFIRKRGLIMFLMMGINDERKELEFSQMVVCDSCGAYGRYTVFMTCTVLSLFLIPLFRWNRKYYVRTSCCGSIYELDAPVGARIARGESVEIRKEDLNRIHAGSRERRCARCGFATREDFEFCPKCGNRF